MTPKQFKQYRLILKLTQSQLAIKLCLSPKYGDDYISMIENGKREPSEGLLKLFGILVSEHCTTPARVYGNVVRKVTSTISQNATPEK